MSPDLVKLSRSRALSTDEMALIELYQRQDALCTQLWQQFLFANVAIIAVIVLLQQFVTPETIKFVMAAFVLVVWLVFVYGNLSALRNAQNILLALGHQIQGDVGDKTELFTTSTRSRFGLTIFHVFVDLGVAGLGVLLITPALWGGIFQ